MPSFSKNFIFGAVIAILLVTTVVFGVLWGRTREELGMRNKELGNLQEQLKTPEGTLEETQKESEEEAIDTSNWKTYRNEEYGFEVRYPTTWKQCPNVQVEHADFHLPLLMIRQIGAECEDVTDFDSIITITREPAIFRRYPTSVQLKEALENAQFDSDRNGDSLFIVNGLGLFEVSSVDEISFDTITAVKVYEGNPTGYPSPKGIYLFHNRGLLRIEIFDSSEQNRNDEIDQILSTFKFIE